jgi:hypothetical protein
VQWFRTQTNELVQQVRDTVSGYMPWLLPDFAVLQSNPALGKLGWGQDLSLEKLPVFIELLQAKLLLAQGGRNAVEEAFLRDRLRSMLPAAKARTQRLIADLRQLAEDAGRLVQEMDFRYLYDRRRKLLSIGSDGETGKVHAACYDLLASEARIAAFLAIAKDDIPQESWFLLSRSHVVVYGRPVLMSWTGTMFEYLMPMLWMRSYPATMLENTKEASVFVQQMYADHKGVPWGISESAFAKVEENGAYGYRAFGVPQLALQQDEERLVVAPYATMLAVPIDPAEAIHNLRWMTKKGWFGKYGYYEAADFTRDVRPSRRQRFALVRSWMVHHQGMGLLAIANFLKNGIVQDWFGRDARVQATELLLQERPAGRVAAKPQKKRRGKPAARKTSRLATAKK